MPAETTPTTPRDSLREPESGPRTEAGRYLTTLLRANRSWPLRMEYETPEQRVLAIEEQAAAEARRELLAKVEELRREYVALPEEGADSIDAAFGDLFNRIARLIEEQP